MRRNCIFFARQVQFLRVLVRILDGAFSLGSKNRICSAASVARNIDGSLGLGVY